MHSLKLLVWTGGSAGCMRSGKAAMIVKNSVHDLKSHRTEPHEYSYRVYLCW